MEGKGWKRPYPRKMMGGKAGKGHPHKNDEGEGWKSHAQERGVKAWKTRKLIDLNQKHDKNNL